MNRRAATGVTLWGTPPAWGAWDKWTLLEAAGANACHGHARAFSARPAPTNPKIWHRVKGYIRVKVSEALEQAQSDASELRKRVERWVKEVSLSVRNNGEGSECS